VTYFVVVFFLVVGMGWALASCGFYLWRRAEKRAREQAYLRYLTVKQLTKKLEEAERSSFSQWLKSELPKGLVIYRITSGAPVHAEGQVDGFNFFFRARGNLWHFEIAYPDDPSYSRGSMWRIEEQYGLESFAASWMPQSEALAFILNCAARFREILPSLIAVSE
jgi:hypothetical protein